MLLDLRVVIAASLATVLVLIAGFGLIAGFRTSIKPSIGFTVGGPPFAQAYQPPANSQPIIRPTEIVGSISEKPGLNPPEGQAQMSAVNPKKNANVAPQEQSMLTDADKKASPDPIAAAIKANQVNEKAKERKRIVRTKVPPVQNRPSNPFSIFSNQNNQ